MTFDLIKPKMLPSCKLSLLLTIESSNHQARHELLLLNKSISILIKISQANQIPVGNVQYFLLFDLNSTPISSHLPIITTTTIRT